MFQTIVIVILFIIIIYLILDKKNLKAEDVKSFLGKFCQKIKDVASLIYSRLKSCSAITKEHLKVKKEEVEQKRAESKARQNEFRRQKQEEAKIRQEEFIKQNHTDDGFIYKENTGEETKENNKMYESMSSRMKEDENIVFRAKIHWVIIIPYILLICAGVMFGIYGFLIALTLSIFTGFLKKLVTMLTTELYFTNKVIYGKKGFINTKDLSSPLDKIHHVSVESGLDGKLLGYGTIVIDSISGKYNFPLISKPEYFRNALLDAIEQYKEANMEKQAQRMAAAIKSAM